MLPPNLYAYPRILANKMENYYKNYYESQRIDANMI